MQVKDEYDSEDCEDESYNDEVMKGIRGENN